MKRFKDMTEKEIEDLSDEEFYAFTPEERRDCNGCYHLVRYVTRWCTSHEASKFNGTYIPGFMNCKFWKKKMKWWELWKS